MQNSGLSPKWDSWVCGKRTYLPHLRHVATIILRLPESSRWESLMMGWDNKDPKLEKKKYTISRGPYALVW